MKVTRMKNATHPIQTKLNATLSAALLALVGAVNLASPSAAVVTASLGSASFGSTGLALAVQAAPWLSLGAALMTSGESLAATNKPVVGVGIKCCKRPGGCSSSARTAQVPVRSGVDGSFQFIGLEPGDYDVTPDGGKTELYKVGADGKLSGFVQEENGVRSVVKMRPGGMGPAGPAGPANTFSPTSTASGNSPGNANPSPNSSPKAATPPSSAPVSTERGIKDNGVKGCTGCDIRG